MFKKIMFFIKFGLQTTYRRLARLLSKFKITFSKPRLTTTKAIVLVLLLAFYGFTISLVVNVIEVEGACSSGDQVQCSGTTLTDLTIDNDLTVSGASTNFRNAVKAVDGSGSGIDADLLDNISSGSFLRSDASDSFTGQLTMSTQKALIASNYGHGVYGVYDSYRYQHVWSMGAAYNLPANGVDTSGPAGNLYGLAWSYPRAVNPQAISGLSHQLLLMMNGTTYTALGNGIWTRGNLTLSGANPYIYSGSSYIVIPNGLYISGGTAYFENQIQVRRGIRNDGGSYSGRVYVADQLEVTGIVYSPSYRVTNNASTIQDVNQFYCNNANNCHFNYSSTGNTYVGNAAGTWVIGNLSAPSYSGGGCDIAERYEASEDSEKLEPGDIVIMDSDEELKIKKSDKAYSTMVIGVISTNPNMIMGVIEGTEDHPPVALLGRVPTKVSTENGAIKIGDYIVSSSKPGYGMKCDDFSKCQSAIIGKALQKLEQGEGMIEVLIKGGF